EGLSRMTGNLSRTVLRGAGVRESACLPDLTTNVYFCGLYILKR
ncbi:hypothetical protein SAMN04487776_1693, partial [Priestia megaterium]